MKKALPFLFLLIAVFNAQAQKLQGTSTTGSQQFQGVAIYESKTSTADMKEMMSRDKNSTPEMQKSREERVRKLLEKTFVLNFDKSESIYKEEEKLETPGQNNGGFRMMAAMMGGGGTFYKNVKEKFFAVDREFLGKEFLVKDSLPKLEWKLEGETKKIGDYTCYKATASKPISPSDFRNFRPKKKEDSKKEEEAKTEKTTNIMDDFEMPTEIKVTAWYAPEIPVNQGPENYWGLPGLILEVSDDRTTILCSKIILNAKEKVVIKAPSNGKVVTQKEYDEIVEKKTNEMREMRRNNGGRNFRFGN